MEDYYSLKGRSFNRVSFKQKRLEKKIQQLKLLKNPSVVVDCRIQIIEEDRFFQVQLLDGIKEDQITQSLNSEENQLKLFQAAMGTNGESGVFEFVTADGKYKIKSITPHQRQTLIDNLDAYINHLKETNNQSLLARVYGMYCLKTKYYIPVTLILMQNTAHSSSRVASTFEISGHFQHKEMTVKLPWIRFNKYAAMSGATGGD